MVRAAPDVPKPLFSSKYTSLATVGIQAPPDPPDSVLQCEASFQSPAPPTQYRASPSEAEISHPALPPASAPEKEMGSVNVPPPPEAVVFSMYTFATSTFASAPKTIVLFVPKLLISPNPLQSGCTALKYSLMVLPPSAKQKLRFSPTIRESITLPVSAIAPCPLNSSRSMTLLDPIRATVVSEGLLKVSSRNPVSSTKKLSSLNEPEEMSTTSYSTIPATYIEPVMDSCELFASNVL